MRMSENKITFKDDFVKILITTAKIEVTVLMDKVVYDHFNLERKRFYFRGFPYELHLGRDSLIALIREYYNIPKTSYIRRIKTDDNVLQDFRINNFTTDTPKSSYAHFLDKEEIKRNLIDRATKKYSTVLSDKAIKTNRTKSKLTLADVNEIRELSLLEDSLTHKELASKYNLKRATISDIINFRTWNEDIINYSVKDKFSSEYSKISPQYFTLKSFEKVEDIKKGLWLKNKYSIFIEKELNIKVFFYVINDIQCYAEYYQNDIYLGSSQFMVDSPYVTKRKTTRNIQIIINNPQKYSTSFHKLLITDKKTVVSLINSIDLYIK